MGYKSQNNETEVVINYFNGYIGTLLDLGANDGETLSNSYDLIKLGWKATLVEPVKPAYENIVKLYNNLNFIEMFNFAIGDKTEIKIFYNTDNSLVATSNKNLLDMWGKIPYNIVDMQFYSFNDAYNQFYYKQFDFISIDCEGMDWIILQQIDLSEVGCKCICIEQGNSPENYKNIKEYCKKFGLEKELLYNFENVIFAI